MDVAVTSPILTTIWTASRAASINSPASYLCRRHVRSWDTAIWDLRGNGLQASPWAELLAARADLCGPNASSMSRDITPKDEAARLLQLQGKTQGLERVQFRVGFRMRRDA